MDLEVSLLPLKPIDSHLTPIHAHTLFP